LNLNVTGGRASGARRPPAAWARPEAGSSMRPGAARRLSADSDSGSRAPGSEITSRDDTIPRAAAGLRGSGPGSGRLGKPERGAESDTLAAAPAAAAARRREAAASPRAAGHAGPAALLT
jgi:hypothetical protein